MGADLGRAQCYTTASVSQRKPEERVLRSGHSKGKAKYESGREELPAQKAKVYLAPCGARCDVSREENGYRYAEIVESPYRQGQSDKCKDKGIDK